MFWFNSAFRKTCLCIRTVCSWIFFPFPPKIQLPASNIFPVHASFWVRFLLACGLTCWAQIRTQTLTGPAVPWETELASGVCYSVLLTCPSDEVGSNDEMHTSRQALFRANRIRWPHTHKMKTYNEPIPSCFFYNSHPENGLFSWCIVMCSTSVTWLSLRYKVRAVWKHVRIDPMQCSMSWVSSLFYWL